MRGEERERGVARGGEGIEGRGKRWKGVGRGVEKEREAKIREGKKCRRIAWEEERELHTKKRKSR